MRVVCVVGGDGRVALHAIVARTMQILHVRMAISARFKSPKVTKCPWAMLLPATVHIWCSLPTRNLSDRPESLPE